MWAWYSFWSFFPKSLWRRGFFRFFLFHHYSLLLKFHWFCFFYTQYYMYCTSKCVFFLAWAIFPMNFIYTHCIAYTSWAQTSRGLHIQGLLVGVVSLYLGQRSYRGINDVSHGKLEVNTLLWPVWGSLHSSKPAFQQTCSCISLAWLPFIEHFTSEMSESRKRIVQVFNMLPKAQLILCICDNICVQQIHPSHWYTIIMTMSIWKIVFSVLHNQFFPLCAHSVNY